jgi:hypothetical protein
MQFWSTVSAPYKKNTFQKTNQSSESSFQIDYIIIPSCEYL